MKAIIRREIMNYLKRPLFWCAIVVVLFGAFQQLNPYLSIHYITTEEELKNDAPKTIHEGEIFEGFIPSNELEHRELWEETIQETLLSEFGMSKDDAAGVIQKISGMDVRAACMYLEEQYSYYNANYIWEDTAYRKGTMDEINSYIENKLNEHPFSYYFSRKFADFAGLFTEFAAIVLLAVLYFQDMRKDVYELLHTKPISATQYILGKMAGGLLVCLIILGILNLAVWMICLICASGNGFEVNLTDFLMATCLYILPNILMIVSVYTIVALLFRNPLPAVPLLILYMVYSNMGSRNAEGIYGYYGRPLAIIVRFPGMFFEAAPPKMVSVNQLCLIFASMIIIFAGIQLWRRRRI